jgi:hypothetical protein
VSVKVKYLNIAIFCTALSFFNGCSRPRDMTPDAQPDAKVISIAFNTVNMANGGSVNSVDTVKAGDQVVKFRLAVTSSDTVKYIYIVHSGDNGTMTPLPIPTTNNEYGVFTNGSTSTYSLRVPTRTSFNLDIAVAVRNTATAQNDVYKIWLTKDVGSFSMPAYKRILGTATISLIYKNSGAVDSTYSTAAVSLGSQSSRNYGSLLSTAAQVAAMDSVMYLNSPKSADIRLVTLTGGKKDNNSSSLWLYSPADVASANPAVSGQDDFVLPNGISRTTYFGTYSGAEVFDSLHTATLIALPDPTQKSIEVSVGGTYVFKTQAGKKGLIKITSTAFTTAFGGTGSTTAQNAGVSIKVLN